MVLNDACHCHGNMNINTINLKPTSFMMLFQYFDVFIRDGVAEIKKSFLWFEFCFQGLDDALLEILCDWRFRMLANCSILLSCSFSSC